MIRMAGDMKVAVCKLRLHLPENGSLKDKRRILQSIMTRVRNKYEVAISEVDDQELWQVATLGIACVADSSTQANEVMSKAIDFIHKSKFEAEIIDCQMETIPFS